MRYLYEAVLRRNDLSNGTAQAGEIRQFAIDRLGFQKDDLNLADLERFLKAKL